MKIDFLHTNNLRNDVHFQFFREFQTLVERFGAEALKIGPQYDAFLQLFHDEDAALKKIRKSGLWGIPHNSIYTIGFRTTISISLFLPMNIVKDYNKDIKGIESNKGQIVSRVL